MCVVAGIAGAGLVGAVVSSSASKGAAQTQANAENNATQAQTALTNQALANTKSNNAPYMAAGNLALSQIEQVLGLTGSSAGQGGQVQGNYAPQAQGGYGTPPINPQNGSPTQQLTNGPAITANGALPNPSARPVAGSASQRVPISAVSGGQVRPPTTNTTSNSIMAPGGFDPNNIPGYTYGLQQADNTLQNSALARGTGLSGNTLQALQGAGQAYAGTAFQNYLGDLSGVAQLGQASANNSSVTGANLLGNLSSNVGSNIVGAGNATAAGQVGSANSYTSAINGGLNAYGQQQALSNAFGDGSQSQLGQTFNQITQNPGGYQNDNSLPGGNATYTDNFGGSLYTLPADGGG